MLAYGTKTKALVEVLNNLGYTTEPNTENLPNGWRAKVEAALKRQNINVHETTIYTVRLKAVAEKQAEAARKAAMPVPQKLPVAVTPAPIPAADNLTDALNDTVDVKLNDVIAIVEFAKPYGGIKQLAKMIESINAHPISKLLKE